MDTRIKIFELFLRQKFLGKGMKGKSLTPQIVSYTVTSACNFRCAHCHASAGEAMPNELTIEEARKVINEMAELGTEVIIFSGGEPLLKRNLLLNLTEYCNDLGIMPAMLTNGTLLDSKTAWELKNAGMLAVGIPLDSVTPERHDKLRNTSGAFENAIRAIKACHNADLTVVVTTMLFKNSIDELPKLMNLLADLNVEQAVLYDFIPVGRGKDIGDLVMTDEQRVKLLDTLYRIQEEKEMFFLISGGNPLYPGIILKRHENYGTNPPNKLLKHFLIDSPVGCHAGIHYLSLRSDGNVYPCPFLQLNIGNIREQSLTSIWYNSKILKELRDRSLLKGKCGECGYREICGGCRARAWLQRSDYLASDPNCPIKAFSEKRVNPAEIKCFGICVG
jgi:radical SAM protein with 4Fe4S-binding SPASM domain